ncbi:MAG: hypothetical protein MK116_07840 [Phycisphaerales bacterium]|nr:hypothetical protein [Phycisphaerales bacterium]
MILVILSSANLPLIIFGIDWLTQGNRIYILFLPILLDALILGWLVLRYFRLVRRARENDFRLCLHCAYVLAGLPDDGTCPECGKPYRLEKSRQTWESQFRR